MTAFNDWFPSSTHSFAVHNVKGFGAVGDGVANDASAIQSAVDYATSPYSSAKKGIIHLPVGTYLINSAITFPSAIRYISFQGAQGATITGNIADALLKRAADSPFGGSYNIENLELTNSNAAGKAIAMHSCIGATIKNCHIHGTWRAIETSNSQSITVQDCAIIGTGTANGVGVVAGNGTTVLDCDITGFAHGIRHCNIGLTVLGGRYESNTSGIVLGVDPDGGTLQSTGFFIGGCSMEANGTAIDLVAAARGSINGVSIGSGVAKDYGLRIRGCADTHVAGVGVSNGVSWNQAGISLEDADRVTLTSCQSDDWNIAGSLLSFELRQCNTTITVATLPTSAEPGTILVVSDANATTVGSTVAGGGANTVAVVQSAGVWRII